MDPFFSKYPFKEAWKHYLPLGESGQTLGSTASLYSDVPVFIGQSICSSSLFQRHWLYAVLVSFLIPMTKCSFREESFVMAHSSDRCSPSWSGQHVNGNGFSFFLFSFCASN